MDAWEDELVEELKALSARANAICNKLTRKPPFAAISTSQPLSFGSYARGIIKGRARLREWLDGDLFADPAFEILLDLFAAEEERKAVCISSACVISGVPASTALRWIGVLERRGLIERTPDPDDRRRIYVSLRPQTRERIQQWLTEISSIPLRRL